MSSVIANKQNPLEIRLKEELKLDMKEWKGPILNAKFEMAEYLGVITYYGIKSVVEFF
jgi:hypothetical protein